MREAERTTRLWDVFATNQGNGSANTSVPAAGDLACLLLVPAASYLFLVVWHGPVERLGVGGSCR